MARLDFLLQHLAETRRVLMIGAHPDDEDTELLTWATRHVGAEAAYLSLTRGEGGQNLIGDELGVALGLLRTRELEAARALDGAHQFFTRAYDFGYTRSREEAERFWPADSILKDVVRIIRRFRPHVIVTVFSGTPRDGHGQHQYAGRMALRGFAVAGDPAAFPELGTEEGLEPWTPLRLFRARAPQAEVTLEINGGVIDHRVGKTIHQIAMESRSQHRSQDFGVLQAIGPSTLRLALLEDRTGTGSGSLLAGVPLDSSWLTDLADSLRRHVVPATVASLVAPLRTAEQGLAPGTRERALLAEAGRIAAGQLNDFRAPVPVLAVGEADSLIAEVVREGRLQAVYHMQALGPADQPYFLDRPLDGAWYDWSQVAPDLRGLPFQPSSPFTYRSRDQAVGEVREAFRVAPRVGVTLTPDLVIWPAGDTGSRTLQVTLTHFAGDTTTGTVGIQANGWAMPPRQSFTLVRRGQTVTLAFAVRAQARQGAVTVQAVASTATGSYTETVRVVDYPHIRAVQYLTPAEARIHVAPLTLPAVRGVGYVRGAADRIPEVLLSIGLPVVMLDSAALAAGDLSVHDVIVVGPRAYEADSNLVRNNDRLLAYMRRGGHLVVQYQQYDFVSGNYAPHPLTINRPHDRITDENAPVRVLRPEHAVFRSPNRLTEADWRGWPQERGLYFAGTWDDAYTPLLEMQDPGLDPVRGGLLAAPVGAGSYIYTGISFFRAIPAGNAGALRLFLNLLAFRGGP